MADSGVIAAVKLAGRDLCRDAPGLGGRGWVPSGFARAIASPLSVPPAVGDNSTFRTVCTRKSRDRRGRPKARGGDRPRRHAARGRAKVPRDARGEFGQSHVRPLQRIYPGRHVGVRGFTGDESHMSSRTNEYESTIESIEAGTILELPDGRRLNIIEADIWRSYDDELHAIFTLRKDDGSQVELKQYQVIAALKAGGSLHDPDEAEAVADGGAVKEEFKPDLSQIHIERIDGYKQTFTWITEVLSEKGCCRVTWESYGVNGILTRVTAKHVRWLYPDGSTKEIDGVPKAHYWALTEEYKEMDRDGRVQFLDSDTNLIDEIDIGESS